MEIKATYLMLAALVGVSLGGPALAQSDAQSTVGISGNANADLKAEVRARAKMMRDAENAAVGAREATDARGRTTANRRSSGSARSYGSVEGDAKAGANVGAGAGAGAGGTGLGLGVGADVG